MLSTSLASEFAAMNASIDAKPNCGILSEAPDAPKYRLDIRKSILEAGKPHLSARHPNTQKNTRQDTHVFYLFRVTITAL